MCLKYSHCHPWVHLLGSNSLRLTSISSSSYDGHNEIFAELAYRAPLNLGNLNLVLDTITFLPNVSAKTSSTYSVLLLIGMGATEWRYGSNYCHS